MSYQIGKDLTDTVAFFGATPIARPSSAAQAAVTDSSGGTPATIAAAAFKQTIVLELGSLAALANSQVYKIAVPFAFTVTAASLRVGNPVTTGAKAATLTTQISGAAATGGVISAAGTYATGATQAGTAITAGNTGAAGDTLEIAVSAVTAFTEGTGVVEFTVTNTDLANAAATSVALPNALRSALVSLGLIKGS